MFGFELLLSRGDVVRAEDMMHDARAAGVAIGISYYNQLMRLFAMKVVCVCV